MLNEMKTIVLISKYGIKINKTPYNGGEVTGSSDELTKSKSITARGLRKTFLFLKNSG